MEKFSGGRVEKFLGVGVEKFQRGLISFREGLNFFLVEVIFFGRGWQFFGGPGCDFFGWGWELFGRPS